MDMKLKDAQRLATLLYEQSAGITTQFHRNDIMDAGKALGMKASAVYKHFIVSENRVKRGYYSIKSALNATEQESKPEPKPQREAPTQVNLQAQAEMESIAYVPNKSTTYVKHGPFSDVLNIVQSKKFFPIYIYGPSGNGKTLMVEQACAHAKREYLRVNLSPETCEDDLIGGWRLINGNTVFEKGPVIKAMEAGAVLLLDEVDRATNKILCLQSVLEGRSILLKKTGETIYPNNGFTVIVTANTSGRGSDDGKYTGASIIDDAFLERFPIAIDQPWPSKAIEKRIILKSMEAHDCVDEEFADKLVVWSKIIRKTYESDGIDEVISTRRLDHVVQTFAVFQNRLKSIEMVTARFPQEVREAFVDLYTKIDEGAIEDEEETQASIEPERKTFVNKEAPF